MVVVDRHLTDIVRHRGRQLARRVDIAENDIGNGIGCLGAAEPYVKDGGYIL